LLLNQPCMQQRKPLDFLRLSLKGMAMGAADVVPGVSGGTMALIVGVYEELLGSLSSLNYQSLRVLKTQGFTAAWKAVNGSFLLALFAGVLVSIFSLATLISWLLNHHPILVWSFFFGLVLASVVYVGKQLSTWTLSSVLFAILAAFVAYHITTLQPLVFGESSAFFLFLAGSIAICAMILPGISGSFILVLLGAYKPVLEAVHTRNIPNILFFMTGAVIGLLTFSKLLKWLFVRYKDQTLAVLTGFILGSLNKIWPWKKTLTVLHVPSRKVIPFSEISELGTLSVFQQQVQDFETYSTVNERSVLPLQFSEINHYIDDQFLKALPFFILGVLLILLLEITAGQSKKI